MYNVSPQSCNPVHIATYVHAICSFSLLRLAHVLIQGQHAVACVCVWGGVRVCVCVCVWVCVCVCPCRHSYIQNAAWQINTYVTMMRACVCDLISASYKAAMLLWCVRILWVVYTAGVHCMGYNIHTCMYKVSRQWAGTDKLIER